MHESWKDRPEEFLEGYRLLDCLSHGGTGVLYKAKDLHLGSTVAIKVLPPRLCQDELFEQRLRSNLRVVARVESPFVLPIHACRRTREGALCLVTEYIAGDTVADLAEPRAAPLRWQYLQPIAEQVLCALTAIHQVGIIHGCINPHTLLLTDDQEVRVDMASPLMRELWHTEEGAPPAGVLAYWSPEQIRQEQGALDVPADIYAVGATLFRMLAGRLPFEVEGSTFGMLRAIVEVEAPLLSHTASDVPGHVVEAVARALAKDPSHRFPSAEAMRLALHEGKARRRQTSSPL